MAKHRLRSIKIVEKFLKNAEKEKARARGLIEKCESAERTPLLMEVSERLKQKELQSSGDMLWAEQQIELAREEKKREAKQKKKHKAKSKDEVGPAEA